MSASLRSAWPAAAAGAATAITAMAAVLIVPASPTLAVLAGVALLVAVAVVWSGNPGEALLFVFVAAAPIAITKSLVTREGLYPPSLELWLSDIPLVGVLAFALARALVQPDRDSPRLPDVFGWLLLGTCGWSMVCALAAERPVVSVFAVLTQVKFAIQFVLVRSLVTTPRAVGRVLAAAAVGLGLNLAMAAAQAITRSPLPIQGAKVSTGAQIYSAIEGLQTFRPSGLLLHPNPFASFLVLTLPVPIAFVLLGRRRLPGLVWDMSLALAASGGLALLLTLSRGGWVSGAVALAVLIPTLLRAQLVPPRTVAAYTLLGVTLLGLVLAVYPTVVYRLTRGDQRSSESRLMLMAQATLVIRDNPITGIGPGNYENAASRYTPSSFAALPADYRASFRHWIVHNGYLLIWAERGIVGLLLQLTMIATVCWRLMATRSLREPQLRAVAIGLAAGVAGQSTFYLFDHFYQDLYPGILWLVFGLSAAIIDMADRESQRSRATV